MKTCQNHGKIQSGTVRQGRSASNARYLPSPAVRQAFGTLPVIARVLPSLLLSLFFIGYRRNACRTAGLGKIDVFDLPDRCRTVPD